MKTVAWHNIPRRRQFLLLAVVVTMLIAGLSRLNIAQLPLPGTLRKTEEEVRGLRRKMVLVEEQAKDRHARIARINRQAATFWQKVANPQAEMAGELEKVARRSRITLQNMGAPRSSKIGDNLTGTEISIQVTGSMHDISQFLAELDRNSPRFFWISCTITPDNPRTPRGVTLNGRLQLVSFSQDAAKFLEKG